MLSIFSLVKMRGGSKKERKKERGRETLYQPQKKRNNTAAVSPQQSRPHRRVQRQFLDI